MRIKLLILAVILLFFGARPTFAASIDAPTNVPSQVQTSEPFTVNSNLTNVQPNDVYFIKCRMGPSSSSLTEGQTYNSTTTDWLFDTNAWTDMPTITATTSSTSFSIQCRVKSNATEGQKVIYMRACLKKSDGTCGTSFQSSSGITFAAVTQSSSPTSSPSSSPSPSPISLPTSSISSSSTSSFTISNVPSQINSTDTFNVSVNLSVPKNPNTTFYLKGAFKKEDSSNYFGLTKVSGSWIKNNKKYSEQYKIVTDGSGNWSGNLDVMADSLDSGYEGGGDYIFKAGKYTESGSLSWSNEVSIKINAKDVVLEDSKEGSVLGTAANTEKSKSSNTSKSLSKESKIKEGTGSEFSSERYIKPATAASKEASASPSAEVKGERQINFLAILGIILVIIGAIPIIYAIYNKFRKANQGAG